MSKDTEFRVGCSGYQYPHWRNVLYPDDLPKTRWFERYAEVFDTVEINNTFYNLPKGETFDKWREQAPAGFRYILKFSRYGSHIKKLKSPEDTIGLFLDRAERLKGYLGPILVQLPPGWNVNVERLSAFLDAACRRRRWALEFRNQSWLCPEIYQLLSEHNAALVIHDLIDDHPRKITADWVYLRFHGPGGDGQRSYPHQSLSASARWIKELRGQGRDVYAYFNNDPEGNAVRDAQDLRRYVEGG
jgi:uncharacterized protein YecE (DUF72 family)